MNTSGRLAPQPAPGDLSLKVAMFIGSGMLALLPLYWWLWPDPNGHGLRDYLFGGMPVLGLAIELVSMLYRGRGSRWLCLAGFVVVGLSIPVGFLYMFLTLPDMDGF
ncbi:MAG: hypothetical protein U0990_06680 [Candidatus Nanopelagicales bacterium]|nr:hypothetical protein [Candidatus Nanopelagicales bacterium]MDZ4249760.1 hypothetical protein [Candidatus Nanopelagicales bacterium]